MNTQNTPNNSKLDFSAEKVANLSENEMETLLGGKEKDADAGASTRTNFTCGWCTSTTVNQDAA